MRILSSFEHYQVHGALTTPQTMLIGMSCFVGASTGLAISLSMQPLLTAIGVPLGAVALGGFCAQFSPFLGVLGCGVAGGALGYQYGDLAGMLALSYGLAGLSGFYVYAKLVG